MFSWVVPISGLAIQTFGDHGKQAEWRQPRLRRLEALGFNANDEYKRLREKSLGSPRGIDDRFNANSWLRRVHDLLRPLFSGTVVIDIEDICNRLVYRFEMVVSRAIDAGFGKFFDWSMNQVMQILSRLGVAFPQGKTWFSSLLRLKNIKWWRKQVTTIIPRIADQVARREGQVNKADQCYISNVALAMYRKKQKDNKSLLESLEATNSAGQSYTLAELAEKGTSNAHIRRTEMMVRIRGLEEYADDIGFKTAEFITLTAPSKYHSHNQKGFENGKWNLSNPRNVNDYFNGVWARIRADLARQKVKYFGIRVAEPHHDGCPHWHILLFTSGQFSVNRIRDSFLVYGYEEDGFERGAALRRIVFEPIDKNKGSAVGYIAKYISKAIDGRGIENDLYGNSAGNSAERIVAWSRIWGIRQFQFFGCEPIGVWRELRRVRRVVGSEYEEARLAADQASFRGYCHAMVANPLKLHRPEFDHDTGEFYEQLNQYGELGQLPVKGVMANYYGPAFGEALVTRLLEWTVGKAAALSKQSAVAWTCVTNCTADLFEESTLLERTDEYLKEISKSPPAWVYQ